MQQDAEPVPVYRRQVAVQHDHVVAIHEPLLQSGLAVVCEVRRDPAVAQTVSDVLRQFDVILGHEYAHADIVHHDTSQRHHRG